MSTLENDKPTERGTVTVEIGTVADAIRLARNSEGQYTEYLSDDPLDVTTGRVNMFLGLRGENVEIFDRQLKLSNSKFAFNVVPTDATVSYAESAIQHIADRRNDVIQGGFKSLTVIVEQRKTLARDFITQLNERFPQSGA